MNGFCCTDCKFVFPLTDACTEYVPLRDGGPATRYSCPECLGYKLTATHVCPECFREELAPSEDLGKRCLQAQQEAIDELTQDRWREAS